MPGHRNNGVFSARVDVMSCKVHKVSCMQWVWFHTYIGCDVMSQVGLITQIHWVFMEVYTLTIMSKTLQVSCHSYSGCDVTSVVYVMSYTVGLYSGILWM